MKSESYTVIFEREADGGYSAWVPDLPGCASQGDSYDEALRNVREAIACHIEGLRADGLPVPEHRTQVTTVEVT